MQQNKTERRGGHRPNTGRPHKPGRQRLELDQETARSLYLLAKFRQARRIAADPGLLTSERPELTEEMIVAQLVAEEWRRVEEAAQPKANEAQEPCIL